MFSADDYKASFDELAGEIWEVYENLRGGNKGDPLDDYRRSTLRYLLAWAICNKTCTDDGHTVEDFDFFIKLAKKHAKKHFGSDCSGDEPLRPGSKDRRTLSLSPAEVEDDLILMIERAAKLQWERALSKHRDHHHIALCKNYEEFRRARDLISGREPAGHDDTLQSVVGEDCTDSIPPHHKTSTMDGLESATEPSAANAVVEMSYDEADGAEPAKTAVVAAACASHPVVQQAGKRKLSADSTDGAATIRSITNQRVRALALHRICMQSTAGTPFLLQSSSQPQIPSSTLACVGTAPSLSVEGVQLADVRFPGKCARGARVKAALELFHQGVEKELNNIGLKHEAFRGLYAIVEKAVKPAQFMLGDDKLSIKIKARRTYIIDSVIAVIISFSKKQGSFFLVIQQLMEKQGLDASYINRTCTGAHNVLMINLKVFCGANGQPDEKVIGDIQKALKEPILALSPDNKKKQMLLQSLEEWFVPHTTNSRFHNLVAKGKKYADATKRCRDKAKQLNPEHPLPAATAESLAERTAAESDIPINPSMELEAAVSAGLGSHTHSVSG